MRTLIGAGEHGVNSYHHQAVKDLAPKAEAMAYSEDGLVEAISGTGQNVYCRCTVASVNLLLKKIWNAKLLFRRLWMPANADRI